jgi:hypothetical protein
MTQKEANSVNFHRTAVSRPAVLAQDQFSQRI